MYVLYTYLHNVRCKTKQLELETSMLNYCIFPLESVYGYIVQVNVL